jgi:hypothetical protein
MMHQARWSPLRCADALQGAVARSRNDGYHRARSGPWPNTKPQRPRFWIATGRSEARVHQALSRQTWRVDAQAFERGRRTAPGQGDSGGGDETRHRSGQDGRFERCAAPRHGGKGDRSGVERGGVPRTGPPERVVPAGPCRETIARAPGQAVRHGNSVSLRVVGLAPARSAGIRRARMTAPQPPTFSPRLCSLDRVPRGHPDRHR